MNWKIGDVGIFVYSNGGVGMPFIGNEIEVVDAPVSSTRDLCVRIPGTTGYSKGWPEVWCIYFDQIKPIPDTYDGLQISSWSECPWNPEVVRA